MRRIKDKKGWPLPFKIAQVKSEVFGYKELPKNPKPGVCYNYYPLGAVCANGSPWMGTIRLQESKNLLILLSGGGEAVDEYMIEHPTVIRKTDEDKFYFNDIYFAEMLSKRGIAKVDERNPFRDWNVVCVPYATGDFHCGTRDYAYTDSKGETKICHFKGYENYRALMNKVKELVPNPEKILMAGSSAGAYGTALLCNDFIEIYPECQDITFCVDSALFQTKGFADMAKARWGVPKTVEPYLTDDLVLTPLKEVSKRLENRAKILYMCSTRDAALTNMRNYFDGRGMQADKEGGQKIYETLQQLVRDMQENIPNLGLYIFDTPFGDNTETKLSIHTLIAGEEVFTNEVNGVKAIDWLWNGVNGSLQQIGLEYLAESE